ncbi:MAG: hypothetical protein KDK70_06075 [Myxococcales bacterium]|nr:hypothetical protein [Myxococcales bacterium]
MFDAFFWLVLPVAVLEAVRIARSERKRQRRSLSAALAYGGLELVLLGLCAATSSPILLLGLIVTRVLVVRTRERQWWGRGLIKAMLHGTAMLLLVLPGRVYSFADLSHAPLDSTWRLVILTLVCVACAVAILPVHVSDEPKETLAAPVAFVVFARVAIPLGDSVPQFAVVVPIVAAVLSLVCALWLLSAGARANHFEPSTLVSEIVVCERGVVLSFVWLGLASGEHLAGVGALLEWWSGALALLALEASLRRRPLPKPMAFFALAMAVSLPGTMGFVAEDLLAHGLLELRPLLAAAFVGVAAINAAALYLAIVNIIVDLRAERHQQHQQSLSYLALQPEERPSFMMLGAGGLSLLIGLLPRPFVATATDAHVAIVHNPHVAGPHGSDPHGSDPVLPP